MIEFNLSDFSKYRTQLMGIAAIMIILCHAPAYGVEMPHVIRKMLIYGNLGVDMFLFLSGIGCCYSLSKGPSLSEWYRKRFMKIFVPYTIIQFPFVLYHLCTGKFNLLEYLYTFSTVRFWTEHVGAWYVALLIPLYLVTPWLYKIHTARKNRLFYTIAIITTITLLCSIEPYSTVKDNGNIIYNVLLITKRCVSFCVGLYLGPLVAAGKKVNMLLPTSVLAVLYVLGHVAFKTMFVEWCLVIPVCAMCIFLIMHTTMKSLSFITWMGTVSLESYLANIYLKETTKDAATHLASIPFLTGGYVEYGIIILGGFLLAYFVNKASTIFMRYTR